MPGIISVMNWSGAEIPEDMATLQALVRHQREQLAERDAYIAQRDGTIERLQEHINVLLAKRFGASAETVAEAQLGLFNEAELEAHTGDEPEETGSAVAAHRRGRPTRKPLPVELPRVDVEHPLAQSERVCAHHGVALERFGFATSEPAIELMLVMSLATTATDCVAAAPVLSSLTVVPSPR